MCVCVRKSVCVCVCVCVFYTWCIYIMSKCALISEMMPQVLFFFIVCTSLQPRNCVCVYVSVTPNYFFNPAHTSEPCCVKIHTFLNFSYFCKKNPLIVFNDPDRKVAHKHEELILMWNICCLRNTDVEVDLWFLLLLDREAKWIDHIRDYWSNSPW